MEVPLSLAVFIYLSVFLIVFLILWLVAGKKAKKQDFSDLEARLWNCPVCGSTYVDSKDPEISPCPRCGTLNKKTDTGKDGLYGGTTTANGISQNEK